MSVEQNKEVVERFYEEAINQRDLDAVERLLSDDFTHNDEQRGVAGERQAVAVFLDGFSDLRSEILIILGEGDLVAAHQRWSGTHDGEFAGMPATGRRVEFTSTAVLKLAGGRITAAWDEVDMLTLTGQLSD